MNFERVLQELSLQSISSQLESDWAESENFLPQWACLTPDSVRTLAEFVSLDNELKSSLIAVAEKIQSHPALLRLFRHGLWLLSEKTTMPKFDLWPATLTPLGEQSGLFYLLLGLSLIPRVQAWHQSMRIPETITRETCRQIREFSESYRRGNNGANGVHTRQLSWWWNYPRQRYFRLGRFEYWLKPYDNEVRAYRHRTTGRVVALAKNNIEFDAAGFRANEATLDTEKWKSYRSETPEGITGFPIDPAGKAIAQAVTLSFVEWTPVLKDKDWVLDLHIPQGGGMTPDVCLESHRLAIAFFERHFPENPFVAIVCKSWMFNPQLEEILSPESNLLRYMKDFYLVPIRSEKHDGLWFIFLQDAFDPETAPQETSLQRSILQFLKKGHRWRNGGMFILKEDALRIGEQYYRSQKTGIE